MKPCIKVVHIANELKMLVDAKDKGTIDKFEFYRMLNNIDEKIDALFQMDCPHQKEFDDSLHCP